MACKCIRKLVVVMMELLILFFLKVQANNLAHTSFRPSSHPIQLSYFSKLYKVQNNILAPTSFSPSPLPILYHHSTELDEVQETMRTCVDKKMRVCEETHPYDTMKFKSFDCFEHPTVMMSCIKECHEKHLKDQDVVSAQNPKHKGYILF
ncbi:uncharacterized protein LOC133867396 isoform X3 [Alnus glutinosa]|uniref:uncharacterized protein LOC133867396 isoform X3 n=1 Tax=Alnus glutinosa TaxID=3517 RepID=UPI002D77D784|nr:uncharacterized protein LOC133867396 isoform X3 [Alnus glutinosa]